MMSDKVPSGERELNDADIWMGEAWALLTFIRDCELVVAVDEDVWLATGSAESQLAAWLRDRYGSSTAI